MKSWKTAAENKSKCVTDVSVEKCKNSILRSDVSLNLHQKLNMVDKAGIGGKKMNKSEMT